MSDTQIELVTDKEAKAEEKVQEQTKEQPKEQAAPVASSANADAKAIERLVAEFKENMDKQRAYEKKQLGIARLRMFFSAAALVVVLVLVFNVWTPLSATLNNLWIASDNFASIDTKKLIAQVDEITDSILVLTETATTSIGDAMTGVDSALSSVDTALAGVDSALSKVNELDIKALNKSISDLSAIVGPMAKLFR